MNFDQLPSLNLPDTAPAPGPTFNPYAFQDVHTGVLTIKEPDTGASTPMTITLAGPEHPERKRRLWQRQRRLRQQVSKTGKMPVQDPEEDDADELDELVCCTLGWKGAPEPYSQAAARKLYTDLPWLRHQVRAALDERDLFIRRSAPN